MSAARKITHHQKITLVAEDRGGRPARVASTPGEGVLRCDFGDEDDMRLAKFVSR